MFYSEHLGINNRKQARMDCKFNLYTMSRLEDLAAFYSSERKNAAGCFRVGGVMSHESVTVPTRGMAIWLEHYLVNAGHVVAGMDFPFTSGTINKILEAHFGGRADYRPELFTPQAMTWRLYGILGKEAESFGLLNGYLWAKEEQESCEPLRRYQLAAKLAMLYDQYISYIPEKLQEAFTDEGAVGDWQLALWRRLCLLDGKELFSPAAAMTTFLQLPEAELKPLAPVTFFGVSAMPPIYLRILKKLASKSIVNFFYHNPCDAFWADQKAKWENYDEKGKVTEPDGLDMHYENTLLGNFGIRGRQFFRAVMELDNDVNEHWVTWTPPDDDDDNTNAASDRTILRSIQDSIITRTDASPNGFMLDERDDSLTFHSCHNELREVEVLQDCILKLINDRHFALTDFIVMAPDISQFAPAIHAVFGSGPLKGHYAVSDKSIAAANPVAAAFMNILSMPDGNFEISRISSLLDCQSLQRHFGLEADSTEMLLGWLGNAGIRWGRDGTSRVGGVGESSEEYTWRYGLDRLLLSLAINQPGREAPPAFAGIAPVPFAPSEENMAVLGAICTLFRQLCDFVDSTKDSHSATEWLDIFRGMLPQYFADDEAGAHDLHSFASSILKLRDAAAQSEYREAPVPFEVVRCALQGCLLDASPGEPFLNGKLTFCSMLPMRGIPCRVIAMLGMDEGTFPRADEQLGFSLMNDKQLMKYYDRSRSIEDRYIFLEALLAARDYLMLFYRGQDEQKPDTALMPASPVGELLDFAGKYPGAGAGADGNSPLVVKHTLNPFDRKSFATAATGVGH